MTKEEQFSIFWGCFPRKIAKANARKAFDKAIKKTTLERMLDAITKYVAHKPQWQDYKHPASWLNSEGWDDEWEPQQASVSQANRSSDRSTYLARERLFQAYRDARDEGNKDLASELKQKLTEMQ